MVYSLDLFLLILWKDCVSDSTSVLTSTPPSTLNMWEYDWALVCVRERCMCLFVFVSINVWEYEQSLWARWCEGEKARGWERVNEGLRFMQSPYYSVNTQSVSLHIREQNSSEILPLGVIQLPFPHTHIQRQWLLLSETEMHYVLSLTLSTTYSHKTARMNTQLHRDTSEMCVWIKGADRIRHVELPKYILGICWAAGVLSFAADGSFTLTVILIAGGHRSLVGMTIYGCHNVISGLHNHSFRKSDIVGKKS